MATEVQYKIEDRGPVEKSIRIEVPPERVDRSLRDHFSQYRNKLKIPGFRPGKIPMDLLEKEFGAAIRDEVRWDLVNEVTREVFESNQIRPFTHPRTDPPPLKTGEAYSFDLTVEVQPQIQDVTYKGLPVRREEPQVTEFEMNEELDRLRKIHFTLKPVEEIREPRSGDIVLLDMEGTHEGKPFKGGTGENIQAELGTGYFEGRFEQELIKIRKGEAREFDYVFPPEHWDKAMAGKSVHFTVRVRELKEKLLMEVGDEFAQTYFNETDLASLKDKVRTRLMQASGDRARRKMKSDVVKALVEKNPVDVPPSFLALHQAKIAERVIRDYRMAGQSEEQARQMTEERAEEIEEAARREAGAALLIEHVAREEKLKLDRSDVEAYFKQVSSLSGSDLESVRRFYSDERKARELAASLLEEKILDLMLAHAIMTE